MKLFGQVLIFCVLVVASSRAEEPTPSSGDPAQTPKPRSITATAARGVALLKANDHEGFLREILPPADWQMIAGVEKLRAKYLRRAKEWDDEIIGLLRTVQDRGEEELAFNGDRTEAVTGFVEHLESGEAVVHGIAVRRIGDTWYLNWVVKGEKDFTVRVRDRERIPRAPSN